MLIQNRFISSLLFRISHNVWSPSNWIYWWKPWGTYNHSNEKSKEDEIAEFCQLFNDPIANKMELICNIIIIHLKIITIREIWMKRFECIMLLRLIVPNSLFTHHTLLMSIAWWYGRSYKKVSGQCNGKVMSETIILENNLFHCPSHCINLLALYLALEDKRSHNTDTLPDNSMNLDLLREWICSLCKVNTVK